MHTKEYSTEIGGKKLTALFTDLADQAHGSVILKYGETMVLATAVMSKEANESLGFFNLTVDYVEKFYASGKILGSRYTRREGKPGDEAVLASRVIDRTIRPLFDHRIKNAVQVIATVLSVGDEDPSILAVNATSLALAVSNIPWAGPIGCVTVQQKDGALIINPSNTNDLVKDITPAPGDYDFDLIVCGKNGNINMIEACSFERPEEEITRAFESASAEITKLEAFQKMIVSEIGKEKRVIAMREIIEDAKNLFKEIIEPKMMESLFSGTGKGKIHDLHDVWKAGLKERFPTQTNFTAEDDYYEERVNDMIHDEAVKNDKRADGRKMDEIRNLFAQAGGVSNMLHGSGIFYRGATHTLSILTLGGPEDAHAIESMETNSEKRFMHHYNFPPYSVGETGRATMVNRREIGHGALAEKALAVVLPTKDEFPYTIRVVAEAVASNGSTSQAAICAGSLALMDGGVPIKRPVAGIAMGLMYKNDSEYKVLTDIQGPEDHHGDMDFKVAGTRNGVAAIQLDVKVEGVPIKILTEAMMQAKTARMQILDVMETAIKEPRKDLSIHAPRILSLKIRPDQIGMVIGSGGKVIKDIKERTGAEITIEDDGSVFVTGKGGAAEKAKEIIEAMTHEYKPGETYEGTVVKIIEVGAIVEFNGQAEGLVHISEIANFRVNRVTDVLKEGMKVPVKVIAVDNERGRISLSIREMDRDFIKNPYPPKVETPKPTPPQA